MYCTFAWNVYSTTRTSISAKSYLSPYPLVSAETKHVIKYFQIKFHLLHTRIYLSNTSNTSIRVTRPGSSTCARASRNASTESSSISPQSTSALRTWLLRVISSAFSAAILQCFTLIATRYSYGYIAVGMAGNGCAGIYLERNLLDLRTR